MARFSPLVLALLVLLPWVSAAGYRPYDPIQDANVEVLRRESRTYEIDYVLENEDGEIVGFSGQTPASIHAGNETDFSEKRSPLQKRFGNGCSPTYARTYPPGRMNFFVCRDTINREFAGLNNAGRVWRVDARKSRVWAPVDPYNPDTGATLFCRIAIYNPGYCSYYDAYAAAMLQLSTNLWDSCASVGWGGVIPVDNWGTACVTMGGDAYNVDTCDFQ
ncbi:hypothetical protein GP486_005973 [Trichoglossum hirsutum]|uniref:Uncharacterized protein n=1 Tax=Trichoglossum hirsutum TaxID=265104 RepID=A0A9P8RLQ8_9PEZI|nr:hypothetical protein GP486_005973 [Trichoglossum hirsutum]